MKLLKTITLSALLICFTVFSILSIKADSNLVHLYVDGQYVYHYGTSDPMMTPDVYVEQSTEFRGAWVATVSNLNMSKTTSEANFKAQFDDILDELESIHANAILFQTRPTNDAYYDSDYAPWSKYLTGTEGLDPGWDPMAYMVSESHARGIEFHAWMNPYRVANSSLSKSSLLASLHPENFAVKHPEYVVEGSNGTAFILNPGEPAVRDYIADVVDEIMDLYDVDGIHFDDYFYPYGGLDASEDLNTYNTYKTSGQSLEDFRRESVNQTIAGVKATVDAHNQAEGTDVRFGVSPGGVWEVGGEDGVPIGPASQSNTSLYADSKRWVEEGWVHYINPQIYWGFNHSIAPYGDIVTWWADLVRGTDVDLYIGHGIYKELESSSTWSSEEIGAQLTFNQQFPEIKGSVLYRLGYFNTSGMTDVKNNYWTETPLQTRDTSTVDQPEYTLSGTLDGNTYRSNVTLTFTSSYDVYYKIGINGTYTQYVDPIIFNENGTKTIYYKAVDGTEESLEAGFDIIIDKINDDIPTYTLTGDKNNDDYLEGTILSLASNTHEIWYRINHGSVGTWTLYDEAITFDEAGYYYISIKTIDPDGIESETVNIPLTIVGYVFDAPEISIDGIGTSPYYQSATISLTSDASEILYNINDGPWLTYSSSFILDEDGEYDIQYKNNDDLGEIVETTIFIDTISPEEPIITIDGEKEGNFYKEEVSVTLEHDDTIYYRIHNGSTWGDWQVYTEPISFIFNANYKLEYYAVDQALNQSDTLAESIRLDIEVEDLSKYVVRDGEIVTYYNSDEPIELPETYEEKDAEIRGVWVATVSNIDIGMHYSKDSYQAEIIQMLDRLEALNFNTMFFQVRPMNDAFYESDYAPWSKYIMGAEGSDPGWDILTFIIEEAHKRGIEFHAWLNPYRVSTSTADKQTQLDQMHDDNFAKQNPDLVLQDSAGKLILNPGEPRVRAYINNVVSELMTKYDVDGIHFDDYFYSYSGMDDSEDASSYNKYGENNQSLDDWRRSNIDTLIEGLSQLINQFNTNKGTSIEFGISPFGIWSSTEEGGSNTSPYTLESYGDQYADSKKWVEEGWLDYILPQLYWEFDHGSAPYADLVDWWAELCEENDVDLIIGHGFYRYADDSWEFQNELLEQIRYANQYDSVIGSALFSYKTLNSSHVNVVSTIERLQDTYWTTYPSFPWESDVVKVEPIDSPDFMISGNKNEKNQYVNEFSLVLTADETIYYRINDGQWLIYDSSIIIDEAGTYSISYKTVSTDNESDVETIVIEVVIEDDEPNYVPMIIVISSSIAIIGLGAFIWIKKFMK